MFCLPLHYSVARRYRIIVCLSVGNIFFFKGFSRVYNSLVYFQVSLLKKWSSIIFVYHCIMQHSPESRFVFGWYGNKSYTIGKALFKQLQGYIIHLHIIKMHFWKYIIHHFSYHCIRQQSKGSESLFVYQILWKHIIHY